MLVGPRTGVSEWNSLASLLRHATVLRLVGECLLLLVLKSLAQEGSTGAFLMASTRGRLLVLGGNPLHGSDALDSWMGACLWDLSLGRRTGDGEV